MFFWHLEKSSIDTFKSLFLTLVMRTTPDVVQEIRTLALRCGHSFPCGSAIPPCLPDPSKA